MAVDKSRVGGLWLVFGIPGTGKTILGGIADGIIPAARSGRTIFTNVSGLSVVGVASLASVPPITVDIRFLETIQDVLEAFDLDDATNCVFVLDEMKQMLARDKKAVDWLCQRLNIMRKRSNDFIMIAQVSKYFDDEIRQLAKGCTLYKRCFSWGSKSRTREYRFDGGDIKIENGKLAPQAYKVRRLPRELFTVYQSGIDGLIGVEDNGRTNSVWTSPKAIIAYFFIFFVCIMLSFGVYMFFNIKDSVSSVSSAISGRGGVVTQDSLIQKRAVEYEKEQEKKYCFSAKICDSLVCKTDAGDFPPETWSSDVGGFVTPAGVVFRCSGY